jgi:hypothetical protein
VEIEALVERKAQERFAGYQSSRDKELATMKRELEKLRKAVPVPAPDDDDDDELTERIAAAERERDVWKALAAQAPDVRDAYQRLYGASTVEEQVATLAGLLAPKAAPTQTPAAPTVPEPAPVDPNNPSRVANYELADGTPMTAELAAWIISQGPPPRFG